MDVCVAHDIRKLLQLYSRWQQLHRRQMKLQAYIRVARVRVSNSCSVFCLYASSQCPQAASKADSHSSSSSSMLRQSSDVELRMAQLHSQLSDISEAIQKAHAAGATAVTAFVTFNKRSAATKCITMYPTATILSLCQPRRMRLKNQRLKVS